MHVTGHDTCAGRSSARWLDRRSGSRGRCWYAAPAPRASTWRRARVAPCSGRARGVDVTRAACSPPTRQPTAHRTTPTGRGAAWSRSSGRVGPDSAPAWRPGSHRRRGRWRHPAAVAARMPTAPPRPSAGRGEPTGSGSATSAGSGPDRIGRSASTAIVAGSRPLARSVRTAVPRQRPTSARRRSPGSRAILLLPRITDAPWHASDGDPQPECAGNRGRGGAT